MAPGIGMNELNSAMDDTNGKKMPDEGDNVERM